MNASERYTILSTVFCVCLIASNIFETIIFKAGPLTLTGGFLIFPVSYIINDCLTEVYGYRKARMTILTAFAVNLAFVLVAQIVRALPAVDYCEASGHFDFIFTADFRITCASMLAFLTGSLLNSKVMVKMKERQGEDGFGWRAVASSLVGESVDSLIFFPIAFYGVGTENIIRLMVTQIVLKTVYEIIILPLSSAFVRHLKSAGQ